MNNGLIKSLNSGYFSNIYGKPEIIGWIQCKIHLHYIPLKCKKKTMLACVRSWGNDIKEEGARCCTKSCTNGTAVNLSTAPLAIQEEQMCENSVYTALFVESHLLNLNILQYYGTAPFFPQGQGSQVSTVFCSTVPPKWLQD